MRKNLIGFAAYPEIDRDGNGTFDQTKTDVKSYNLNGTITETIEARNNDASLVTKTLVITSGNGLRRDSNSGRRIERDDHVEDPHQIVNRRCRQEARIPPSESNSSIEPQEEPTPPDPSD